MGINSIDTCSSMPYTTATANGSSADKPESVRSWTDEKYLEETIKLCGGNGERAWEVDREAYIEETRRRAAMAERSDQFYYVLRDFSEGIIDDGFGPRTYSGYDSNIFYKMAATFSAERKIILNNFGGYLSDGEVDYRLGRLHEQFDEAFAALANIIKGYADNLGNIFNKEVHNKDVSADVKAYGEMIKFYVCSGNSVPREGDSSAVYGYLSNNTKALLSLDEINKIGFNWHSKFMKR